MLVLSYRLFFTAVQQTMRGEPTQNVVKIPETYSWRANLMDGTSSGSVGYQVTTSRRAAAGSAAEERNLVSVTEPFRSDDSFWNLYRKTACHHAGVVKVDTADRDVRAGYICPDMFHFPEPTAYRTAIIGNNKATNSIP